MDTYQADYSYDEEELPPAGVPVDISNDMLKSLTVPRIKAELMSREVFFPSKLRKQELLDLL